MSGGSNECLQAENAGPITCWNKKNGSYFVNTKLPDYIAYEMVCAQCRSTEVSLKGKL